MLTTNESQPASYNIAIICSGDRNNALAKLLCTNNRIAVIFRWQSEKWLIWDKENQLWISSREHVTARTIHLVFYHTGDDWSENAPKGVIIGKRVGFSAAGHPESPGLDCSIYQPFVSAENCPLDEKDIEEFLDWAAGLREDPPNACIPNPEKQLTSALAILCQGFLVAHFSDLSSCLSSTRMALEQMGWIEFVKTKEGHELAATALANREETEKSEWWRAIFGDMEKPNVIQVLRQETRGQKLPQPILELVDVIFKNTFLTKSEVVAGAYLALAQILQ